MTKTIHDKVDKNGAIKHYIEKHGAVPLWVLVNYLTIGNLAHLYDILIDSDKNVIAKYYADKYKKQYAIRSMPRFASEDLGSALKIINLVRNKCAHDERLYNSNFGPIRVANIANYFGCMAYDNSKLIVAILYLKLLLDKKYFQKFYLELIKVFERHETEFRTVAFSDILKIMGITMSDLQKLK